MYHSRLTSALAMAALAAILLPSPLPAQITFQRTYGGEAEDWGRSVQRTADGGYIIGGETYSFGAGLSDFYLVRTTAQGETLWTRSLGGTGFDYGRSVCQAADGGYVIVGTTESYGVGGDAYVVKTDALGNTVWARTFGGSDADFGESVWPTADSGSLVAVESYSFGAGSADVYLVKANANGDTLWTRTIGGTNFDCARSVQQTPDGGYVAAGFTSSFGAGSDDVYLIKTDAHGDTLWTRTFGGADGDRGFSVAPTTDGGYVVAGYTHSYGAGYSDVYLLKTDASGNLSWTKTFGGEGYDEGNSVQQTTDGGYIIAGHTTSFGAVNGDVYLIKTDDAGDTMWTRTFGGEGGEVGYSVQQTADGGYVIAGITGSFGAVVDDVYLIKTDSLGTLAVAESKTSPARAPALALTCEPNPTAGATTIHLTPFASRLSPFALRIYDAQGRAVRSFSSLLSPPSSLTCDGRDDFGQPLPSGAYFVRLDAAGQHATTRIVLQR